MEILTERSLSRFRDKVFRTLIIGWCTYIVPNAGYRSGRGATSEEQKDMTIFIQTCMKNDTEAQSGKDHKNEV